MIIIKSDQLETVWYY